MTKQQLGIVALVAVTIATVVLVGIRARRRAPAPSHLETVTASAVQPRAASQRADSSMFRPGSNGVLTARPSADIAHRNEERSGFAWILRPFGASEKTLDRLADGDLDALVTELKQQAAAGDGTAINVLGWIAHQKCYLARSDEQIDSWEQSQLSSSVSLPSADAAWFAALLQKRGARDRQFASVCNRLIDQNQVTTWVTALAKQGDGASLLLLSESASNLRQYQQLLREAAASGLAEAQFELARDMLAGQKGATDAASQSQTAMELLRLAADQLPIAEGNLAVCEYSGCEGTPPDIAAAVTHARDAAQKGAIDAMLTLGPQLPAGQIDPDEVTAWNLVSAALQQRGCAVSSINVEWMKSTTATVTSTHYSLQVRALADQYWRDYGTRELAALGCSS
jgi:TPR repeat protein